MKNSTRLAAALLAAFTLAAQIPASAEPANYTILDSYTDLLQGGGEPTGTFYQQREFYNQYVDAGSADDSPFVLTRTTTGNSGGILFFGTTELISGANANTYRLTSTTGTFDFTSFYLEVLQDFDLPRLGTDPTPPTTVPTLTVTSSAGHTQTFSASVEAQEIDPINRPGEYRYVYYSGLFFSTHTLNWSGVDWVDFTSQYTKAKVTTFVLTTADPAPAAVPGQALPVFTFEQNYKEFPFIVTGQPVEKRTLGSFSLRGTLARRNLPLTAQTPVTVRVGDYTASVTFGNSAAPFSPNASSYTFNLPDGAVLRIAPSRTVFTWSLAAGDSIRNMPVLVESTNPPKAAPVRISINKLREDAAPLLRGSLKYSTRNVGGQNLVLASAKLSGKARGLFVPAGKIKLWYAYDAGGAEEDALKQAVALLKKDQPKLEVTLERVPFGKFSEEGTIFDKWNKEVAAGGGPDMFTAPNDHTGAQARLKRLAPLDKYLKVDAANFFPRANFEGAKVLGKIYGVPGIAKAVALYYNKTTIPNPPTTTAQLLQMVNSGKKIAINQNAYHSFGFLTGAFGGTLLNANGVCVANQAGFAPALQFLKELKDAGAIFNTDDSVSNQLFSQGAVDMTIQGPWKLGDFREALGDANLGVAKMPAGVVGAATRAATPLAGVDYWYVNPNIPDKQKKLAVAVAMYLFGPKGAQIYSDTARSPMVTLGVQPASERVQTFADAAAAGFPRPQSTEFGNYWGPFDIAINEVLNDEANPVTAVQDATDAMNAANGK